MQRHGRGTESETTVTLKNQIVESINSLLTSSRISLDEAEKLVIQERDRLWATLKDKETLPLVNIKLLEDYWAHAYTDKDIIDKNSA